MVHVGSRSSSRSSRLVVVVGLWENCAAVIFAAYIWLALISGSKHKTASQIILLKYELKWLYILLSDQEGLYTRKYDTLWGMEHNSV